MVDGWLKRAQLRLWPHTCVLCLQRSETARDLCGACQRDLRPNLFACRVCALPLASADQLCGRCLRKPPLFHCSAVPFRYSYPLDHLVQSLKYGRHLECGRVLGELLADSIAAQTCRTLPEMLIPVPLGPQRYRQRGFNQAVEIAAPVGRRLRIPLRTDVVVRRRDTREQTALERAERQKNLRRAFDLRLPLRVRHVAIVDDVVTTGSTVNELARTLRRGGAARIEVWAIARA